MRYESAPRKERPVALGLVHEVIRAVPVALNQPVAWVLQPPSCQHSSCPGLNSRDEVMLVQQTH